MAIILIDIVYSEYEEIKELSTQLELGNITEDQFKDGLIKVLGEALPRGPERSDEIRLNVVKKVQRGYEGGKSKLIVH
jgi:hypothetical protein